MSVSLDLALTFSRAPRSRWLPNKSIGLNILAIAAGVAFLAFSISIYDGYKRKVERIIFSLTPHVTVRSLPDITSSEPGERDEAAECLKVCRAPFVVHQAKETDTKVAGTQLDPAKMKAVSGWLAAHGGKGISASKVLFEEAKLEIRSGKYDSQGARPMRLMGVQSLSGTLPSPRIDLTFANREVSRRFDAGEGVLISDSLAAEIAAATGSAPIAGQSTLAIGTNGRSRDVKVIGIHRLGIHSISRNLIIAPYSIAEELVTDNGGKVDGPTYVGLTLDDPQAAKTLVQNARAELRSAELTGVAWQSLTDLFDQLELYRMIIIVTLALSILVTAINTFVNINILIMERAQQIGILRAMGLTPWRLTAIFVAVGLLQAVVGTTIGYALGLLVGYGLDDYINSLVREFVPISEAGVSPDPVVFGAILAFVAFVNVVTCLLAGRRALKLDIAENLRGA